MADISKVKLLGDLDIVSDERRTWYVVEWKNENGDPECAVSDSVSERAHIIASLDTAESDIVYYTILSLVNNDCLDVKEYVSSGNSRLTF